jgi:3-oxoacyl-[acyl-carrier-protein] synthase-3
MIRSIISGTGRFIPPRTITNFDLEKQMNTSDEWIQQRSGIIERHYAEQGIGSSDLAYEAALKAIADAQMDKSEIDFIIAATLSPDHYFPGIGVIVQAKLGLENIGALDVRNQCSGFIYAISVADQYIRAGTYKKILLVAAEKQSANLDYSDEGRDLAVLFGDGAAAVIIEAGNADEDRGILSTHLFSDGNYVEDLWMQRPSPKEQPVFSVDMVTEGKLFPTLNGRNVFKSANDRISLMVARNLKIPVEKVIRNIQSYGNTTAASIPIALDEALEQGRIKRGDLVMLTAFGSGYTWASAAVKW